MMKKIYFICADGINYRVYYDFDGSIEFEVEEQNPVGKTCKMSLDTEEAKHLRDALSLAIKDAEEDT